ncbi:DUF1846 domain-containing protein [Ruminococcaceae bacterium OttesenSCG-928-A11]|nr:DUF1846 domain-containing protein [Ruminococcaceae bacterium OttesenSCG-928-A11]
MLKINSLEVGFDNEKYIKLQSEKINERIKMFNGKLYMEFGGKILNDSHAARVLPGFDPGVKTEILKKLKDKAEIIFCINASDIEKKKINSNNGISYEVELLQLIDKFDSLGISTVAVVITQYDEQVSAGKFKKQLERKGIKAYFHTYTKGYPTDIDTIVSKEGYGAQPYIETTKPLIIVSAPGPNSGKLATCLAQMYHDYNRGIKAGYAKFETFPVWDLPLKYPVNMAYEAATADIGDVNMIDNFHLEKYGKTAVNYNRDLGVFPVLKNILHKIVGKDLYYSPTDMGVNVINQCITNEEVIKKACYNEIIRRYLDSLCDYKNGIYDIDVPNRLKVLMDEAGISVDDRKVVSVALLAKKRKKSNIVAIELPNGKIITGKDTGIMTASAAVVVNAIKELNKIKDNIHLISPVNLVPMAKLKKDIYGETELNLPDVLMALAVSEATNPTVELALSALPSLKGAEAHSTVMLPKTEIESLKKLGINITCTDEFL